MFDVLSYCFFFKQKTSYEMRISDWSSDVCSSDLPEIVEDDHRPGQLPPIVRDDAAQGKPVEIASAGEQHDQQDREQEARYGVGEDHDAAGPDIEARAVAHRLDDAERNRDEIDDQSAPDAERDRDRHLVDDQIDDLPVAEEAASEVQRQIVLHHQQEALVRRLVEAELPLQLLDEGRIESLGTAIGAARGLAALTQGRLAAACLAAAVAADLRRRDRKSTRLNSSH